MPVASAPFLDERRLTRALEDQGFKLKPKPNGAIILAPDGNGTATWHTSAFRNVHARNYRNMMGELRRIGFDLGMVQANSKDGEVSRWEAEREELEREFAASEQAAAEQEQERKREATEAADRFAVIDALTEKQRALYERISDNPGQLPRTYTANRETGTAVNALGSVLREVGLIVTTGNRKSARWWPTDRAPEDAPEPELLRVPEVRRGSVRIRHQEPTDPVIRFRRMGERAQRLKGELEAIIEAMVAQYDAQEEELKDLRARNKRLEGILGRAVDAL